MKYPQSMWLKQQKFIFFQFWRLEVQDKVSAGLVSPWLADGHLLRASSLGLFSMLMHLSLLWALISSSYKDTSEVELDLRIKSKCPDFNLSF